jgi:hypothetical protein
MGSIGNNFSSSGNSQIGSSQDVQSTAEQSAQATAFEQQENAIAEAAEEQQTADKTSAQLIQGATQSIVG